MKPIIAADLARYEDTYRASPENRLLRNALYKLHINDLAFCGDGLLDQPYHFSIDIKTMPSTNQKSSGRCWLFAASNVLREKIAKEKNLENFELSQAWLAFWDKFERCNFFLEQIIETAALPVDDRLVCHILTSGVHDGGQWDMFVNIIEKYGILPRDNFPDNEQSSATGQMNQQINMNLKHNAAVLREMFHNGASAEDLAAQKDSMLSKIYTFLCNCYGIPPKTFDFAFKDKDGNLGLEKGYTPLSFKEKYIGDTLNDYVSIIHAPTTDKPYYNMYTVEGLGNVAGGAPVRYLNLPMEGLKAAVLAQMKDGEVVWFGSDCGKYGERTKNLWNPALYDYTSITGLDVSFTKAQQLDYHQSAMNHAMVLCGVHLEDGKAVRWKIENSWGKDGPNDGYYYCTDAWFDQYVYQAVVHKKYLGADAKYLDTPLKTLKPWDPMGTLA